MSGVVALFIQLGKTMTDKECQTCKGSGDLIFDKEGNLRGIWDVTWGSHECEDCNGTGLHQPKQEEPKKPHACDSLHELIDKLWDIKKALDANAQGEVNLKSKDYFETASKRVDEAYRVLQSASWYAGSAQNFSGLPRDVK